MHEPFLGLSRADRREALEFVREQTGRPAHLLEKDVWVVWTLHALFESTLAEQLTFKGGTSLSKAYRVIDRFSEDLDLTWDIRALIPDLVGNGGDLPSTRSQAQKWTQAVRSRLSEWIRQRVLPVLEMALKNERLEAEIALSGQDGLLVRYRPVATGTGYVSPLVVLEFGGRATGEPHALLPVVCEMDGHLDGVSFPSASPQVLSLARTFWEKATAAHVYCAQGRLRGERYARHWHDLVAIASSPFFDGIMSDRPVAQAVAKHKSFFFVEKNACGENIDYSQAIGGGLKIVPVGSARDALVVDYAAMAADGVMIAGALPFDELMQACAKLEIAVNAAAAGQP